MLSNGVQRAMLSVETVDQIDTGVESPEPETLVLEGEQDLNARITHVEKLVSNYETYVSYKIECVANRPDYPSGKTAVIRRYREFDWLHKRFEHMYCVLFVPPLPGKKLLTQFNRNTSGFVDRRSSGLQQFLRRTTRHPVFSSSPDLAAFLTLPKNIFLEYIQANPVEIALLSFMNPMRTSPPLPPDLSPTSAVTSFGQRRLSTVSVTRSSDNFSQSLLCSSRDFINYYEEVSAYISLCQKMSGTMGKVVSQLSNLTLDYSELAKTLDEWPPDVGMSVSEPALGPSLVQKAVQKTAAATQTLAIRLSQGPENTWIEAGNFGEAVKNVLKNREALQSDYVNAEAQIQERLEAERMEGQRAILASPVAGLKKMSNFTMRWKKKPVEVLIAKANHLQDELAFSNSHVRSEFSRWQTDRYEELGSSLTELATAHVDYWSTISEAWRESLRLIMAVQQNRKDVHKQPLPHLPSAVEDNDDFDEGETSATNGRVSDS